MREPACVVLSAIVCVAAFLMMSGGDARAAVLQRGLAELGSEAELITQGRVIDTRAAWDADGGLIHTYVTLLVERTMKGQAPGRMLEFRVVGGEVGGTGLLVHDAPTFLGGEEVIVLLGRDEEGFLSVHGWRQGKHEIRDGVAQRLGMTADHLADVLNGLRPDLTVAATACPVTCVTSTPRLTWPLPAMGEPYLTNPTPMAVCTQTEWLNAVAASSATWDTVNANFKFNPGGTTTLAKPKLDGNNIVFVGGASGALAITYIFYNTKTNLIMENDMVVSTATKKIPWTCAATAQPGKYDVQSVIVHEFGHFLSLDDIYDTGCEALTMFGIGFTNDIGPRTLEPADVCGIKSLYP